MGYTGLCDPISVTVGDVNGDAHPDFVLTCGGIYDNVEVLLGNGDGTFQSPMIYSSGGQVPRSVAIADLNGDGHPDLAVTNQCSETPRTRTARPQWACYLATAMVPSSRQFFTRRTDVSQIPLPSLT